MRRSNGVVDENLSQFHYVEDGHELKVEGASLKHFYKLIFFIYYKF